MEMLRESAPFLVGMLVPPLVMLALRKHKPGLRKFAADFLPALVLGFCTSVLAGELSGSLADGLMAVVIDTSLVYTGSQLAYWLFWRPVFGRDSSKKHSVF